MGVLLGMCGGNETPKAFFHRHPLVELCKGEGELLGNTVRCIRIHTIGYEIPPPYPLAR